MVRLRNPKMFREALEYIRFDQADNERYRDRLDIETLGLGPRTRRVLGLARRWPRLTGRWCGWPRGRTRRRRSSS